MDQSKDLFITQISIIYHVSIMGDGGKQRKSLPFRTLAVMGKDTPLHRYAVVSHKAVKEVICDKLSLLKEIRENSMTISGGGGGGHAKAGVGLCAEDTETAVGVWKRRQGLPCKDSGSSTKMSTRGTR